MSVKRPFPKPGKPAKSATAPQPAHRVFVYGTLKRGCFNHHYLAGQKFVGPARTVPGFRLYDLGSYPGLVPAPDDQDGVTGEVWEVTAECLWHLDQLEGIDEGLYRREPARLLPPFDTGKIEFYVYAKPVAGRRVVGSTWTE